MKLHGYFRSSAAWRVRIALNLKGLDVEYVSHHLRHGGQRGIDDGCIQRLHKKPDCYQPQQHAKLALVGRSKSGGCWVACLRCGLRRYWLAGIRVSLGGWIWVRC